MPETAQRRIPVVGGLAYAERVRRLPNALTVTLEPDNGQRYFLHAIAVRAEGGKVGYVAPEVARRYHAALLAHGGPVSVPARRASVWDEESSGVMLILDFSGLPLEPAE